MREQDGDGCVFTLNVADFVVAYYLELYLESEVMNISLVDFQ